MSRKNRSSRRNPNRKQKIWYDINEESNYDNNRSDHKRNNDYISEEETRRLNKRLNKQVILTPRGENQKNYVDNLLNPQIYISFAIGPAGCGKTMLAAQSAVKGLIEQKYEKIIITRPNVAVDDRDIGFLPGSKDQKMAPWIAPLVDVLKETYNPSELKLLFKDEIIEVVPIAFMRGRTFKDAFIIVDEAQGTTPNSLLSILTRIGDNSKMVVTGDLKQTDHKGPNGLSDFLKRFENNHNHLSGITVNYFNKGDIQRHEVITKILDVYKDIDFD